MRASVSMWSKPPKPIKDATLLMALNTFSNFSFITFPFYWLNNILILNGFLLDNILLRFIDFLEVRWNFPLRGVEFLSVEIMGVAEGNLVSEDYPVCYPSEDLPFRCFYCDVFHIIRHIRLMV